VGFVFQFYHLLPELTALENVLIASMVGTGMWSWPSQRKAMKQRAVKLLESVGLSHRLRHRPAKLSGGERQRVAIARALMNEPDVLMADEPTGNLDAETGQHVLEQLSELHRGGQTIVMVTHDARVAERADRRLVLEDGRLRR
jgi:ABC-type lipoprotein export system ATPase subunit